MSEINSKGARVMGPPPFPQGGRLPGSKQAVLANHQKQGKEESDYCQGRDEQGNKRFSVCCQALHISLFFDGTNNNNDNDTRKGHPTNIARLFHASYRDDAAKAEGYFSYYMPGVGTPFPEIGEFEYNEDGLKFATGGEDRINWALVQMASALSYALDNKKEIGRDEAKAKVERMSTLKAPLMSRFGPGNRRAAMRELLEPLRAKVQQAQPRPLAIKLFVYGFSRGAAEARTFVNWLAELFDTPKGADKPEQSLIGLPVSVEFLGLLDTVASVGIAHVAPFFSGHMGWAAGTQLLPDTRRYPDFIRQCRHFVATHEQRSCFPLDSLRDEEGLYPHSNALEVIYPGVHSDVGGGYIKGDQGKARGGTHELLSQIVLHDLYAEAFAAGAPLQVPEAVIPESLRADIWRVMSPVTDREFEVSDLVIGRFNAWRTTVTGLAAESSGKAAWEYEARPLMQTLEQATAEQLYWITGWRIGRYANGSYKSQLFFTEAVETDGYVARQERADYEQQLGTARDARQKSPEAAVNFPGPPIYEPQVDKTQISEAADEFRFDYSGEKRAQTSMTGTVVDVWLRDSIYLLNDDDEQRDWEEIRRFGEQRHVQLFSDVQGTPSQDPTLALLVAMFDDQVHDSRAWFMHDALKSREMWSGYFFYRMLYFGEHSSRRLTPMMVAGKLVGVAMIAGATVYGVRLLRGRGAGGVLKGVAGGVAGAAAGVLLAGVTYQVIDKVTGDAVPFLPGAADLLKPTAAIGTVAAKQARDMQQADYVERMQRTNEYLRQAGGLIEQARAVLP